VLYVARCFESYAEAGEVESEGKALTSLSGGLGRLRTERPAIRLTRIGLLQRPSSTRNTQGLPVNIKGYININALGC
jgi:hypothetical protein